MQTQRFHMSQHAQAKLLRSFHAPCSTVILELTEMHFCQRQLHSSEFNRFRLSCPGISGDAAFLFGSAVECHLELLNFACSVRNGISYATQAAKWTLHGHCIRFSAGSPTHFDRDRKDATWRGCGMIFQSEGFDSDLCRTITNYGLA